MGNQTQKNIVILRPLPEQTTADEQGKIFLLSTAKEITNLIVSTQWEAEKIVSIGTKKEKDDFPKEFFKFFEPRTTIGQISYSFEFYSGLTRPDSILFNYRDTMSVRAFWGRQQFANLLNKIQTTNASSILLYIKGWKDSTYTTEYDDPSGDARLLYKVNLRLIPGYNKLYFSPNADKSKNVEFDVNAETNPGVTQTGNFHNSELEQSCTTCHEGLPSGSEGKEMKADCSVCHKSIVKGGSNHGPAESNDCTACHEWSVEKKVVIVSDGVPNLCYRCHDEKQKQVEDSPTPHPIASECTTCHSPHSSKEDFFLKQNTYRLCTGCHENYGKDHPVSKHPIRFAKMDDKEISCVSCHNPHGSENKSLLNVEGGRFSVCLQCHQK
jgi:predicted CXXCH cytochrome family protein